MFNKILHLLQKAGWGLTPLAICIAAQDLFAGISYAFLGTGGIEDTVFYSTNAGIGIKVFGIFVIISALSLFHGMLFKRRLAARVGAFGLFLGNTWLVAIYLMIGDPGLALLWAPEAVGWSYVYLAVTFSNFWTTASLTNDSPLL